jgi:predicted RNA-binding Zn-ribbon protein involved in translation (DUF1610 family)
MICPACKKVLPEDAKFCTNCGSPISPSAISAGPTDATKKCPYCGETILKEAKKCKHCGEILDPTLRKATTQQSTQSPPKKSIGCLGWILILFGFSIVLSILLSYLGEQTTNTHSSGTTATTTLPLDASAQLAFHQLNKSFALKYGSGKNEIQQSATFNECNQARRSFLRRGNLAFTDWEGKIQNIQTNQGGDRAELTIVSNLASFKITYQTESLYSIFESTLLTKGSKVYNQIASLRVGQSVKFSGKFLTDDARGIKEQSLTERGSVESPEFIIVFYDVTPLQ